MRIPGFGNDPTQDEINVLGAEFEDLRAADSGRIERYAQYREEISEARRIDLDADIGDLDYGRKPSADAAKRRHRIPLPFGNALNVKHSYRIFGRLPDVYVDRRDESAQERHRSNTMEKIVWGIIHASGSERPFKDGAWDGAEVGTSCFEVYWSIKKQMPYIRAIDPAGVIVVKGLEDPHDFQRVYRMWQVPVATLKAEYAGKTFRGEPIDVERFQSDQLENGQKVATVVQMADSQRVIRFALESRVGLYEEKHGYGFCNYVAIPNIGVERDVFGWADYEFYRALARYLAVMLGREADVMRSVANGTYKNRKSGNSNKKVADTIASGGVLDVGREGDVEPLDVPEMPSFVGGHETLVMELIKMLSFSPDAAWGLASATSGSDRGLQLQPLLELTAMKQANWSSGLSRMFAMCFRMIEEKQVGKAIYRGSVQRGNRREPFAFAFGPDAGNAEIANPDFNPDTVDGASLDEFVEVPNTAPELFQGDYAARFVWANRIDPDDPAYVSSELNKFAHGAISLETLLERLGHQNPEDEMKRIEREAERFPWVNEGHVRLLMAELSAQAGEGGGVGQGQNGGPMPSGRNALAAGLATMLTKDGAAMNADGATRSLPRGSGPLYGGA